MLNRWHMPDATWRKTKKKNQVGPIGIRIRSQYKAENPKTPAKTGGTHAAFASSIGLPSKLYDASQMADA